jgi:ribosomal protein S18 acetylase RimI-like enzyme
MKKFTQIKKVDTGIVPLNTELVFLKENDEQVGSLLLVFEENISKVFSLQILEEHRGKGYAKNLMSLAIQRSKERGYQLMELNTELDNKPANSLYEKLGFELTGIKFGFNNYQLRLS